MRLYKITIKDNGTSFEGYYHDDTTLEIINFPQSDKIDGHLNRLGNIKSMAHFMKEWDFTSFEVTKV